MSAQKAIEISAKLYKCRDQSIWLRGEEGFIKEVEKWKPSFDAVMTTHSCSVTVALIKLLEAAKGKPDEGLLMHVLCAVGCELSEPTLTAGLEL